MLGKHTYWASGKITKMKTINIYLTSEEKNALNKIRAKYRVSLSTLTGKVCYWTYYCIQHYGSTEILKSLQNEYISKTGNNKTSCKPRELNEVLGEEIKNKNIYATNCLKIYVAHDIKKYCNLKGVNKYFNEIDKALQNAYDVYWDYNNSIRNQRRMLKQNKEYWKKALENV